jgi:hypothetical protein
MLCLIDELSDHAGRNGLDMTPWTQARRDRYAARQAYGRASATADRLAAKGARRCPGLLSPGPAKSR